MRRDLRARQDRQPASECRLPALELGPPRGPQVDRHPEPRALGRELGGREGEGVELDERPVEPLTDGKGAEPDREGQGRGQAAGDGHGAFQTQPAPITGRSSRGPGSGDGSCAQLFSPTEPPGTAEVNVSAIRPLPKPSPAGRHGALSRGFTRAAGEGVRTAAIAATPTAVETVKRSPPRPSPAGRHGALPRGAHERRGRESGPRPSPPHRRQRVGETPSRPSPAGRHGAFFRGFT